MKTWINKLDRMDKKKKKKKNWKQRENDSKRLNTYSKISKANPHKYLVCIYNLILNAGDFGTACLTLTSSKRVHLFV